MTTIMFVVCDVLLLFVSQWLAYAVRLSPLSTHYFGDLVVPHLHDINVIGMLTAIVWIATFILLNIYHFTLKNEFLDSAVRIVVSACLASVVLFGVLFASRQLWYSRVMLLYASVFSLILMLFYRWCYILFVRFCYEKGFLPRRKMAIVGSADLALLVAENVHKARIKDIELVGFISTPSGEGEKRKTTVSSPHIIGHLSHIHDIIERFHLQEVVFADLALSHDEILSIITDYGPGRVLFRIVPGAYDLIAQRMTIGELGTIPLIYVSDIRLQGAHALVKCSVDFVFSVALAALLLPFSSLIMFAIKLDSRGPVFFKQERVGENNRLFKMYKFRTMYVGAETMKKNLIAQGDDRFFKMRNDPRITRLGKMLRRLSIDELPQLINVLKGEMHLVGPRPPLPSEVAKYDSWQLKRLRVRPGMTGLWQVSGRSDLSFEQMVRYDLYYIENWSLWLDIKILFMTLSAVVQGRGAY